MTVIIVRTVWSLAVYYLLIVTKYNFYDFCACVRFVCLFMVYTN